MWRGSGWPDSLTRRSLALSRSARARRWSCRDGGGGFGIVFAQVPIADDQLALSVAIDAFTVASKLRIVLREQQETSVDPRPEIVEELLVAVVNPQLPVWGDGTQIHDRDVGDRRPFLFLWLYECHSHHDSGAGGADRLRNVARDFNHSERARLDAERYLSRSRIFSPGNGNQIDGSYVLVPMDWMAEGNCNNHPPAVFFPSDGVGVEIAKKICGTCSVRERCLDYALESRIDHGVWGGTSERQRRRILKARRDLATSTYSTLD